MTATAEAVPTAAAHLPHPPWHPIYRAFHGVIEGIHKRFAAAALVKRDEDRDNAAAMEAERFSSQQFELASTLTQSTTSNTTAAHLLLAERHARLTESEAVLTLASLRVWRVNECRPKQLVAATKLLYDSTSLGKLLVVDRAGGARATVGSIPGGYKRSSPMPVIQRAIRRLASARHLPLAYRSLMT